MGGASPEHPSSEWTIRCRRPERFVHVSTPGIYFDFRDRLAIRESDPLPDRPVNAYVKTKLFAEQAVDEAFDQGLPVVTLRPRALFGPGDTAILPRLIRAHQAGRLFVIGDREPLVDLTFIDNAVDALLLCREAPSHALGRKYNVTNGAPVRLWQVVTSVLQELDPPVRIIHGIARRCPEIEIMPSHCDEIYRRFILEPGAAARSLETRAMR